MESDNLLNVSSFPRYLASKKTVDDRALNQRVWTAMADRVRARQQEGSALRVLEIGAGIGTMFQRLVEWSVLDKAEYTALDGMEENIAWAASILPVWAQSLNLAVQAGAVGSPMLFSGPARTFDVRLLHSDLYDFLSKTTAVDRWDLIIAHAFFDLVDVPALLPRLKSLLNPGGVMYFTINFDGVSIFEPALDPVLDDRIMALYHKTMDHRVIDNTLSGDSQTGRHMFQWLHEAGLEIIEAGSSDWVVYPRRGGYLADEAYFLNFILNFFADSLSGSKELLPGDLDRWVAGRRAQINSGELVYIAHQLDFLAR